MSQRYLHAAEGYGPYNIENNYFFGGMAWMHGGQFSSTHAHTLAGGLWRYNTFHLPEEYLFTNTWEVMFGADNPWKSTADMSVDGLPPHSPRYVVAGRSVDSAPSGHWYWAAYNSGVVGTSKPSCLDIASWPLSGSPTSVQTAYCYDSDPLRASRGTTYCPPQGIAGVTAVPNAGDGVCWQLQYSMNAIKNAWETKDSSNNTLQYNGFIGFPPVGGLNTGQYTVVNVKISSAYYGSTLNYPTIYKQGINSNFPATSSGCFFDLTAFPNPTTDEDGHVLPAGYSPWPFCERSHGDNIAIKNNYFRNISGGIQLVGYYTSGNGGHGMASGSVGG